MKKHRMTLTLPPWLSSIMGGLVGGAGAPLGDWGYWGGAINNILLANAIITGWTTAALLVR